MTQRISILLILFSIICVAAEASAEDRRPGVTGVYSERHLTQARNSLAVVAGPHGATIGGRYQKRVIDGGYQLTSPALTVEGAGTLKGDSVHKLYSGVIFGLFDDWEAGALFLSFDLAPEFTYGDIPIFITKSWMSEDFDIGFRLGILAGDWAFNPGIPTVWRIGGGSRLESGLYVPITLDFGGEAALGANATSRYTYNFTPRIWAGAEAGFFAPKVDAIDKGWAVPVGLVSGYTMALGPNVIEFGLSFWWDQFMMGGVDGASLLQLESYRFQAGITVRKMVF